MPKRKVISKMTWQRQKDSATLAMGFVCFSNAPQDPFLSPLRVVGHHPHPFAVVLAHVYVN
jgi:hypothetical protein